MEHLDGNRAEGELEAESLQARFERLRGNALAAAPELATEFEWVNSLLDFSRKSAPEKKSLSYEYLHSIISSAIEAICVLDAEGVCEYANDAACALAGWSRDELLGKDLAVILPPDMSEYYKIKWREVRSGLQSPYEGVIQRKDGSRQPILISNVRFDINGATKILVVASDISLIKESQKALQMVNQNLDLLVASRTKELTETIAARDAMIEASRLSEQKYRDVVENCGLLVIKYACDGKVLYVNNMSNLYMGREPKDIIGRCITDVAPPEVSSAIMARIRKLVTEGIADDAIDYVPSLSGPRWLWGHPNVAFDANGNVAGVTIFLSDITEQKLAENKLARSEAEYRQLVNYAGFIVVRCDIDGNVQFINDMGRQYLGRRNYDPIGQHITQVWGQNSGEVFMGGINRALEKGKDIERELKMDSWPNGPRWLWSRFNLLKDADDKPESIVFFAHDITEQKRAEVALNESEANFRTFFESMYDMAVVCSMDGFVLSVNRAMATTLGYSLEELIGQRLTQMHPAGRRQEAEEVLAAIVRGEQQVCSIPLARKDGSLVPVETMAWVGNWNGAPCAFGISRNLTAEQEERRRFELLFHSNPVPMALNAIPGQEFEDVNGAFLTLLGCSRDEVIGRTVTELDFFMHPEQQEAAGRRLLEEGRISDIELQVKRKDGELLDGIFSGEVITIQGTNYLLTAMMDITERKVAQTKITESEASYRRVVEGCGLGVAVFDLEARFVMANGLAQKYFDRPSEELVGHTLAEALPGPSGERMAKLVQQVIETGVEGASTDEFAYAMGRRWMVSRLMPLTDAAGPVNGVLVFARDVTDRMLAQQKLQESEKRYQELIQAAGLSITVYDRDLRITLANSTSAARYQKEPEDIIGRRLCELILDESCKLVERHLVKAFESNQVIEEEQEVVLPIGRRWYRMRVVPLRDENGRPIRVTVFSHDISEQKLSAIALHESETRRRILSETAMEAIFMHADGVLLEANRRFFEMFGYTLEESIGQDIRACALTPESVALAVENAASDNGATVRATGIRKDGTHFPCEMHGHNMVYRGRKVRIAAVMDISERVKAETELARLQERMSVAERLAAIGYIGANMAHEVNTPLSVMRLTTQMLIGNMEKKGRKKDNLDRAETMLREIDRVAGIIKRYREMTRPARSVGSTVDELKAVPSRVAEVLGSAAAHAKLRVTIGREVPDLTAKLGSVEDAEQLFFILMENAIQAADGKKWRDLVISGKQIDGKVELYFADDCCGIPPENMDKLFDPFFSTKPRDVGTGLGLCIVKRCLQEVGGQIRVASVHGQGTTFTAIFPAS
jgi:PAS domain S-box-containing protein